VTHGVPVDSPQPLHGTCVLDRAKVAHIPDDKFNLNHPFDAAWLKTLCR
jgi:hypothetical protein